MGRPRIHPLPDEPSAVEVGSDSAEPEKPSFVLSRNAGIVIRGKSRWWPKGHRFDADTDSALIAELIRHGVMFD